MATADERISLIHLQNGCCRVKVSSVLNRDVRQFGKKFMFDDDEETCWNSDQGTPQFVVIEFQNPTVVNNIHIRFQGGFVGSECALMARYDDESDWTEIQRIYPEDINSLQVFDVSSRKTRIGKPAKHYKFVFEKSTDFYGRITVYHLQFYKDKTQLSVN